MGQEVAARFYYLILFLELQFESGGRSSFSVMVSGSGSESKSKSEGSHSCQSSGDGLASNTGNYCFHSPFAALQ